MFSSRRNMFAKKLRGGYGLDNPAKLLDWAQQQAAEAVESAQFCQELSNVVRAALGNGRTLVCQRYPATSAGYSTQQMAAAWTIGVVGGEAPWLTAQFWVDPTVADSKHEMVEVALHAVALHQLQTTSETSLLRQLEARRALEEAINREKQAVCDCEDDEMERAADTLLGFDLDHAATFRRPKLPDDPADLSDRIELALAKELERRTNRAFYDAKFYAATMRAASNLLNLGKHGQKLIFDPAESSFLAVSEDVEDALATVPGALGQAGHDHLGDLIGMLYAYLEEAPGFEEVGDEPTKAPNVEIKTVEVQPDMDWICQAAKTPEQDRRGVDDLLAEAPKPIGEPKLIVKPTEKPKAPSAEEKKPS